MPYESCNHSPAAAEKGAPVTVQMKRDQFSKKQDCKTFDYSEKHASFSLENADNSTKK